MTTQHRKLVEQQRALNDFFDSLMTDVQAYALQQETEQQVSAPAVEVAPPPLIMPLPPVAPMLPVEAEVPIQTALPATQPAISTEETPVEKPAWAESMFQALLFKVAGLTLAVPLVELNGVVEWRTDAITQMPGHVDFYLGLLPHLGKNVAIIDTARLVMPADRLTSLVGDDPYKRLTLVVLIDGGRYGLACDEVAQVITLQPTAVRWRTSRTQRRWLAGTVVEHMCALIDAPAFAKMLAERMPLKAFRD